MLVSVETEKRQAPQCLGDLFRSSRVAFQPICASQGSWHGVEALMRFSNPDRLHGPESPEVVFTRARKEDRILELDFYCRERILEAASEQGLDTRLFMNICPESLLSDQHSVGRTDELVERHGLAKEQIVLEITEETAIHNYDLFSRTVSHYRKQGYRIAIDDFGAGYGGLKMLATIRPDYLKVDRYFIQDIHREPVKHSIVRALVDICENLDIRLVAEGIENGSEFHSILDLGIELRQGFYFARPAFQLSELDYRCQ